MSHKNSIWHNSYITSQIPHHRTQWAVAKFYCPSSFFSISTRLTVSKGIFWCLSEPCNQLYSPSSPTKIIITGAISTPIKFTVFQMYLMPKAVINPFHFTTPDSTVFQKTHSVFYLFPFFLYLNYCCLQLLTIKLFRSWCQVIIIQYHRPILCPCRT